MMFIFDSPIFCSSRLLLMTSVEIPGKILDDLCSRFIINIPADQRGDPVRVLFAVELAHWFYIDFYCTDGHDFDKCDIKDFAQQIFQHCPFLRHYVHNLDEIFSQWRGYKFSVPTYGAVLLDPSYEHVLLVQGFYSRESWGFPKGKVQENETPFKCAIREVMEEVGFDMRDRASENQYLERDLNGQLTRLYIVREVPLQTKFAPKTKNEIKEMRWFPIADLPCHRSDQTPQLKLNMTSKAFFMVIPFVKDLRRWINQKCGPYSLSNGNNTNEHPIRKQSRRRTSTYHGQTPANTSDEQQKMSTQISIDPSQKLQKQLSVQDTIHKHFSQILRNNSITVTDNTTITETFLMRESNSPPPTTLNSTQLTPPSSNDDEKSASRTASGKKSTPSIPRLSKKGQSNEISLSAKETELNIHGHTQLLHPREPLANLTNDIFQFNGPRCWMQFRLNRSEVFRCLHE